MCQFLICKSFCIIKIYAAFNAHSLDPHLNVFIFDGLPVCLNFSKCFWVSDIHRYNTKYATQQIIK